MMQLFNSHLIERPILTFDREEDGMIGLTFGKLPSLTKNQTTETVYPLKLEEEEADTLGWVVSCSAIGYNNVFILSDYSNITHANLEFDSSNRGGEHIYLPEIAWDFISQQLSKVGFNCTSLECLKLN